MYLRLSKYPLLAALAAQLTGTAFLVLLAWIMPELTEHPVWLVLLQGASAAIASYFLGASWWWQAIHLVFIPLAYWGSQWRIAPSHWLVAFGLMLAIFWRIDRSRVPLYLSSGATADAVASVIPAHPSYMLDAGCGDGRLLAHLARIRPDCEFVGVEHAPLPWLIARVRTIGLPNAHVRYDDFWRQSMTPFDVVFVFLSPEPMPAVWDKACREMRPDTVLVSNSFAVPGVAETDCLILADRRETELHLYTIPDRNP